MPCSERGLVSVDGSSPAGWRLISVLSLLFASGGVGLVYEVLWLRELALLLGSTAHAAAILLAVFFLGLAAGGHFWGRRASYWVKPLRGYAYLEAAVALTALAAFSITDLYTFIYPFLFNAFNTIPGILLAVKAGLALLLLFPPAFFMGGTLPALSEHLARNPALLGRRVTVAYAVNTLGAALGAGLAGFYLPLALGYSKTYQLALVITVSIALLAWVLGGKQQRLSSTKKNPNVAQQPATKQPALTPVIIRSLALLSGGVTLGLEVLWTHMFAQVLQNSVYTFAVILVIFLLSLGLGSIATRILAPRTANPVTGLLRILILAGLLVGLSPLVFHWTTNGMTYMGGSAGLTVYVFQVLLLAMITIGPPTLILGMVFPWILFLAKDYHTSTGHTVGTLYAINTAGAIVGVLGAGFFAIDWLGLWGAIRFAAILNLFAALVLQNTRPQTSRAGVLVPLTALLLMLTLFDPGRLPVVRIQPLVAAESLLEVRESGAGTVAVIRRGDSLRLKVNNHYVLGGTGALQVEVLQGHLPLLLHDNPQSVFFLGLGTGITAGAALDYQVQRVLVTELVPQVIEMARDYFEPYINGLFNDPRVTVIAEDGHSYLAASNESFDVIVGDLFVPWRKGTGTLYSREHFQVVHNSLTDDGVFVQWLPLYQLSRSEYELITRTLLDVFPQVTLWRGDFNAKRPIIGLAARKAPQPLSEQSQMLRLMAERKTQDPQRARQRVPLLAHYAGNPGAPRHLLAAGPLNTSDHPLIAYRTAATQRQQRAKTISWFVGDALLMYFAELQQTMPAVLDPYLAELNTAQLSLIKAGLALHNSEVLEALDQSEEAQTMERVYQNQVDRYLGLLPAD